MADEREEFEFDYPDWEPNRDEFIPLETANAYCKNVRKVHCVFVGKQKASITKEWRLLLEFELAQTGTEYDGRRIDMFARISEKWKRPPRTSKLYGLILIACGGLGRRQRVTKRIFVDKLFKIKIKKVLKDGNFYTIAETILEKIAG